MTPQRFQSLTEIGFLWQGNKKKKQINSSTNLSATIDLWEERRQKLIKYKDTAGDTNVSQLDVENKQLGSWINYQPTQYKLLTQGKRNDLWEERRQELIKYKDTVGDTNVSQLDVENKQLGSWVNYQRTQYKLLTQGKPNNMTPKRIQSLNEIEFFWEVATKQAKQAKTKQAKQASTISVPIERKKLETTSTNSIGDVQILANFTSAKGKNKGNGYDAYTCKPGNFFSMQIDKNVSEGVHLALGGRNPPQEIKEQAKLLSEFLEQRDATSSRGSNSAVTRNLLNVMSSIHGTKLFPSTGDPMYKEAFAFQCRTLAIVINVITTGMAK